MDLFAKGHKNNPENNQEKSEREKFQAWQQAENDRLQKERDEYIAKRKALKATMTADEWKKFLQAEAVENAKKYRDLSGAWLR